MRSDYPADVSRFLQAFANHAKKLIREDPGDRNADIDHRVAEQIFACSPLDVDHADFALRRFEHD